MNVDDELRRFLLAIADCADESGAAPVDAVQNRYGEAFRALWNIATDLRYLKPLDPSNTAALTTMGRFAAGILG